jgi:hypothetical protein
MKLNEALEEKRLDVRLRDKWLTEGKVEKSVVEKYLKDLPDDTANMEVIGDGRSAGLSADRD